MKRPRPSSPWISSGSPLRHGCFIGRFWGRCWRTVPTCWWRRSFILFIWWDWQSLRCCRRPMRGHGSCVMGHGAGSGALLCLVAYGTYDFTNLSTLSNWPLMVGIVDLLWGTALSAVPATLGYFAVRQWGMKRCGRCPLRSYAALSSFDGGYAGREAGWSAPSDLPPALHLCCGWDRRAGASRSALPEPCHPRGR